jgi:hypothetical protein
VLAAFPSECAQSVAQEGRRSWLRQKIRILTCAWRGVKQLQKQLARLPQPRTPHIMELLKAAEGRDSSEEKPAKLRVAQEGAMHYALPPEIATMVLARAAPAEFEAATKAAILVQMAYRSHRNKQKLKRLKLALHQTTTLRLPQWGM